jgi:pimeloyl-ACP methyl ester carboxylesterase
LLVWGASDRLIVPAYAKQWQTLIPKARIETIEGAGHMLPYEQPEAFSKAVAAFLA